MGSDVRPAGIQQPLNKQIKLHTQKIIKKKRDFVIIVSVFFLSLSEKGFGFKLIDPLEDIATNPKEKEKKKKTAQTER